MNDKDLIQYEPLTWEPSLDLADLAFQLHAELIRLGEEAQPAREKVIEIWQQQGRILAEFYLNDKLCKALGCEGGWDEYKLQEDVIEALGFNPARMSRSSYSTDCRLSIHSYYSGMNLLESGVKTPMREALPKLDGLLENIRKAKTPEAQEAARKKYMKAIEKYVNMPSREVRKEVARKRPPLYNLPYVSKKLGLYDKDGIAMSVRLADDPVSYFIIWRLTRVGPPKIYVDDEGIGYYNDDGEFIYRVKFEKRISPRQQQRIADSIPYCQRR